MKSGLRLFCLSVTTILLTGVGDAAACDLTEDRLAGWYAPTAGEHTHWITWAGGEGLVLYERDRVETQELRIDDGRLVSETVDVRRNEDCEVIGIDLEGEPLVRIDPPLAQANVTFGDGLSGLLLAPRSPVAGTVYIHGAGESDRDHPQFLQLALTLALNDIAMLLPDKRGSGRSAGNWQTADFHDFAADAEAGIRVLRNRLGDDLPVGVIGLSQGGWVVPILAGAEYNAAFGVILSGPGVSLAEQQRHVVGLTAERMGLDDAMRVDLDRLLSLGERFAYSGRGWRAYLEQRQRMVEGPAAPIASLLPDDPESPLWRVARHTWYLDPALMLAGADVDVLMILGAEDEMENVPVKESRRRIELHAPEVELVVFPGMGHALSTETVQGTHPAVLELLTSWIHARPGVH